MKNIWKKLAAVAFAAVLTAVPVNFTDFAVNDTAVVANARGGEGEQSVRIGTTSNGEYSFDEESGLYVFEGDNIKIKAVDCTSNGIPLDSNGKKRDVVIETTDGSIITKVELQNAYTSLFGYPVSRISGTPSGKTNEVGLEVGKNLTIEDINSSKVTLSNPKPYELRFEWVKVYHRPATLAEFFGNDKTCVKKDLTQEVTITEDENGVKTYTIGEETYTLNQIKRMAFHDYAYRIVEYVEPTEDSDGYYVREKYCKTCGEGKGRNTVKIHK